MRAGVYVRVSSEEQARKGFSLEEQESVCLTFAKNQGWDVVEVYRDPGYSGGSLDRPGVRSLVKDAEAGRLDVVLVWKTDRLSRWLPNIVDLVLKCFEEYGVKFRSATETFDTTSPAGRMLFTQLAAFADFERSMIRERTLMGREAAARKGRWAGGRAPFGYVLAGDRGSRSLCRDEARAVIVSRIFDEIGRGDQFRSVARKLNEEGIKTGEGGYWTASKISRLVANPVYKGVPTWRRRKTKKGGQVELLPEDEWVVAEVVPEWVIVDEDRWQRANRIHETKARGGWTKGRFLLTGILRCGVCGSRYEPTTTTKTRKTTSTYEGYRCGRKAHGGAGLCTNSIIPRHYVEDKVLEAVFQFVEGDKAARDYQQEHPAEGRDERQELEAHISLVLGEIEKNRRAAGKWYAAFESGEADAVPDVIRARLVELDEERQRLTVALEAARVELSLWDMRQGEIEALRALGAGFRETWENRTPQEKKALLMQLLEEVKVFPGRDIEIRFAAGVGL